MHLSRFYNYRENVQLKDKSFSTKEAKNKVLLLLLLLYELNNQRVKPYT